MITDYKFDVVRKDKYSRPRKGKLRPRYCSMCDSVGCNYSVKHMTTKFLCGVTGDLELVYMGDEDDRYHYFCSKQCAELWYLNHA